MSKTTTFIIGILLGSFAGSYLYSTVFDPTEYWIAAKELAYQSARYGCVKAGKNDTECKEIALEFYKTLPSDK